MNETTQKIEEKKVDAVEAIIQEEKKKKRKQLTWNEHWDFLKRSFGLYPEGYLISFFIGLIFGVLFS